MLCKHLINILAKLVLSKLVFLDGKLTISGPVIESILNQKKANKKYDFMEHDRINILVAETNFKNRKKIELAGLVH